MRSLIVGNCTTNSETKSSKALSYKRINFRDYRMVKILEIRAHAVDV